MRVSTGAAMLWLRLGHEEVRFGPLTLAAGWCVSTDKEFTTVVAADPQAQQILKGAGLDTILSNLPTRSDRSWSKRMV